MKHKDQIKILYLEISHLLPYLSQKIKRNINLFIIFGQQLFY